MSVMRMHQVETAGSDEKPQRSEFSAWQAALFGSRQQWRILTRQQKRLMSGFQQRLMQPQNLPLSTTHFPAAIKVQDSHRGISRALAYFTNV